MTNKDSMTRHETAVRTAKMKGGIWAHPLTVDTMLGIFSSPLPPEMPEDCMPRPVNKCGKEKGVFRQKSGRICSSGRS